MSQKEQIKALMDSDQERTIAELHELTGILRPNVRRILGEGAKAGEFSRVAKGVYVLKQGEQQVAWVECGASEDVLRDMADGGDRFDMIFLDPAYYSPELIGRNRLMKENWYDFTHPQQFYEVMQQVHRLTRSDDTHIYLMLSGARSAQKDMQKYLEAVLWAGFQIAAEGAYTKTYASGEPVINIRGKVSAGERLILINKSGSLSCVQLDFSFPRPKGYHTQKAEGLLRSLILQSSKENDHLLDPFAGSGMFGRVALELKRKVTLIEKNIATINNFILQNLKPRLWY